jgi:hypothetical protein
VASDYLTSRAGTGNGTLNALSIDYGLYSKITNKFEFPAFFSGIIEQVVSSIHGVIISFLEQKDGQSFLRTHSSISPFHILNLDINFQ